MAQLYQLPEWIQELLDSQVLSLEEAHQLDNLMLESESSTEELVMAPPELNPLMARVYLWELPGHQSVQ